RAVPTAALNRSRYLLLVFSDNRTPEERANDAAVAQEAQDRQGGESSPPPTASPAPVPAIVPKPQAPAPTAATPATPATAPAAAPATAPA
uniref:hypothetical protein n=1 Tax=Vibrio vulnificus TaxID=672 RepID=UPI0039B60BEC